MKVLVTGVKGQLGHDVVNELEKRGHTAVGVDIDEMDITDAKQVREVITKGGYDAVVHCAAWTAVDKAEDMEEACRKVNKEGTENIAQVCGGTYYGSADKLQEEITSIITDNRKRKERTYALG